MLNSMKQIPLEVLKYVLHIQERKGLDFGGEKALRGAQAVNESSQCLVQVEVIKENFWIQISIFMSSLVVFACTLFESIRMNHIVQTMKKSAMD